MAIAGEVSIHAPIASIVSCVAQLMVMIACKAQ